MKFIVEIMEVVFKRTTVWNIMGVRYGLEHHFH